MIATYLNRTIRALAMTPLLAAMLALALGVASLLVINLSPPTGEDFPLPTHTAAGFILAGIIVLLSMRAFPSPLRLLPLALGLVLASFSIVELQAGSSLALAGAWLLLGIGLGLPAFDRPSAFAIGRTACSALFLLSLLTLLGGLYGAPAPGFAIGRSLMMPVSAAALFALLAVGTVWLYPKRGLPALFAEDSFVGAHVRSLLPMVFAAPILVGAAVAAGYGQFYAGPLAIILTSIGSVLAAGIVAFFSILNLRQVDKALYVKDRSLAAASNGILITDHRQRDDPILYVNPSFVRITGFEPAEILGRNCRFLNEGVDNDPEILQEIRDAIADGRDCVVEIRNRKKSGELFWNRLSLAPIANHRGIVTHFVGVIDDISEKIEQEQELKDALEELRAATDARDTFIRLISHELRTPLNAALTWVRLMEVDQSPETIEKGLATVARSIDSQSRLIDDLVDATRFETTGVRLEIDDVDLRDVAEQTVRELRPGIEPGQTLALSVADGDYRLQADPLRLRQIVRNLISNASKYTPEGGRIDVRLTQAGSEIVLEVADTGIGLSAEDADQLFELFWRGDANSPGLGVGLSIVRSLVEAHNGTVRAASDGPDKGCCFTVRLPRSSGAGASFAMTDAD